MNLRRPLLLTCLTVLVAAFALAGAPGSGKPPFPDLQLTPLDGGDALPLSTFRGRPVLVNFWATWCPPCRAELPELEKVYNHYGGRGLVLASINVDRSAEAARRFVKRQGLNLPFYRVPESELRALGVRSIPTSVLLDGQGHVVQVYQGFGPEIITDLERRIEALLPQAKGNGGA